MAFSEKIAMHVELRLRCKDLLLPESPPDTQLRMVVKEKDQTGKFREIGRSTASERNSNPNFSNPIQIQFRFEEIQNLKFELYDVDLSDTDSPGNEVCLGEVTITLGKVLSVKNYEEKLSLHDEDLQSSVIIEAREISNVNEIEFNVHGSGLDKKDFLGKSNPYLVIRKKDGRDYKIVHQTEKIKDTRKPRWNPFSIRIHALCGGDLDKLLSFQVFDHDNDGPHNLIGECEASLLQIMEGESGQCVLDLINQKKKLKKKDYKNSGKLTFAQCKVIEKYSLLDYLFAGFQLHFACGIDFTGSNGDPRLSSSLHYMGSVNPNDYVQTVQTLGNVLQDYNKENKVFSLGFGAKVPPNDEVSYDFNLNLNENPFCKDVEEILSAYSNVLDTVKLWGPTNIAPIINRVIESAKEVQCADKYFVLLILLDGVITDKNEAIEAIVSTSELPISIVFVGVGNADFSAMNFLNGNKSFLSSPTGQKAKRQNVQFMLYRAFKMSSATALANQALSEIPEQVLDYFSFKDLAPSQNITNPNHTTCLQNSNCL